jgi:hypothetical protein
MHEDIYGGENCRINEHMLAKHLIPQIKHWGPWHAHNAFRMEDFYGILIKQKSGSHHYQLQMLHMIGLYNISR